MSSPPNNKLQPLTSENDLPVTAYVVLEHKHDPTQTTVTDVYRFSKCKAVFFAELQASNFIKECIRQEPPHMEDYPSAKAFLDDMEDSLHPLHDGFEMKKPEEDRKFPVPFGLQYRTRSGAFRSLWYEPKWGKNGRYDLDQEQIDRQLLIWDKEATANRSSSQLTQAGSSSGRESLNG